MNKNHRITAGSILGVLALVDVWVGCWINSIRFGPAEGITFLFLLIGSVACFLSTQEY